VEEGEEAVEEKEPADEDEGDLETKQSGETTITPDPSNHEIKHPLQYEWTYWYSDLDKKQKWSEGNSAIRVLDFRTVEDFWGLYNNLAKPSELSGKADFHMLMEGIKAAWEPNERGGFWRTEVKRDLDTQWLNLLMALIGGDPFDDMDGILGAVCSVRPRGSRVELWTKDASNKAFNDKVGRLFKSVLAVPSTFRIQYTSMKAAIAGSKQIESEV
jgi:translation initiation factor 4E